MEVRRAEIDDAQAMAEVHIASWRWAYKGIMPDKVLDSLDVARRADSWRQGLANPKAPVYVAEKAGEIIGFVSLSACQLVSLS